MTTRAADDRVLSFLRLRHEGYTSGQIGERFCVAPERVRTATVRVAKDDMATGDDGLAGFYAWLGDRSVRAK